MKKILFVCTGEDYPRGAFTFLESLQQEEPVCVTGLFFCPLDYSQMASVSHVPIVAPYLRLREKEQEIVLKNEELFAKECEERHIKYHIHRNTERWDKDLFEKASRFSDLALLSGQLFCEDGGGKQPNMFLQEALHVAECPVLVIPEEYKPVQHLVIAGAATGSFSGVELTDEAHWARIEAAVSAIARAAYPET